MKLIKPSYEIVSHLKGEEAIATIERAARTCYKSEDRIDVSMYHHTINISANPDKEMLVVMKIIYEAKSAREMVAKLISRGHDAMLEFGGNLHVLFVCDRGVSHELVRHRIASFAQESTRYCNYGKEEHVQFIIPPWTNYLPGDDVRINVNDIAFTTLREVEMNDPIHGSELIWLTSMQHAENNYLRLIRNGWTPQQARSVLPNSLKTEINVSANLREWRHIFKQRCSIAAHPQMRELMIPLLNEMKKIIPIVFDDLEY